MNVQQIMEDVILKQHVQIQMEVLVVNVIMDILEMDSIVMVFFFFFFSLCDLNFFFFLLCNLNFKNKINKLINKILMNEKKKIIMNVKDKEMEIIVHRMHCVQIFQEVLLVNVMMDMKEMVLLVMVIISFLMLFFK